MRILTIDTSKNLGWCHGEPGGKPIYGLLKLESDRVSLNCTRLEDWVVNMVKGNRIAKIHVEEPVIALRTSFKSIRSSLGLNIAIGMAADRCGIQAFDIAQQTWRSEFMKGPNGKGIIYAPKMTDEQAMAILIDVDDKDAVRKYLSSNVGDRKAARMTEARRRWLKNRTMQECAKRGHPVEDDNVADALAIWLVLEQRVRDKAATPELDFTARMTL